MMHARSSLPPAKQSVGSNHPTLPTTLQAYLDKVLEAVGEVMRAAANAMQDVSSNLQKGITENNKLVVKAQADVDAARIEMNKAWVVFKQVQDKVG